MAAPKKKKSNLKKTKKSILHINLMKCTVCKSWKKMHFSCNPCNKG